MASISEMIVEQTVMSRSAFVNFRRFSAGADVVVVSDIVLSRRLDVRVAESVVGVGDGSRSGEFFFDAFADVGVGGSTMTTGSSVGVSSFDSDVMLLFVDESSTSGG